MILKHRMTMESFPTPNEVVGGSIRGHKIFSLHKNYPCTHMPRVSNQRKRVRKRRIQEDEIKENPKFGYMLEGSQTQPLQHNYQIPCI